MTTITVNRIGTYLETKRGIVAAIEEQLHPLFKGLMVELEEAAREVVGPPGSVDWYSKMMNVLHALGSDSSLYGYDSCALATLQGILKAYADGAGIRLSDTFMLESGMDQDEVSFSFDCDPWRLLFRAEFGSTYELNTGAFIWVAQPNDDNAGVYLKELYHLELADLQIIHDTFASYWSSALLWGKMRRPHLE